jgi:2-hydroxy-6-oxonona-2,4-dienedioate hydrolase
MSVVMVITVLIAGVLIGWHFRQDLKHAAARVADGGMLDETKCSSIEYQEAGSGVPLLVVHGSGGGHDQE